MAKKRKSGYLLNLPSEMEIAAKAIAETKGQTFADYIRAAVRMKLMADGAGMDGHEAVKLIAQANEPLTRSSNFAAIHAAATLAFMREWLRETFALQGLPDELARKKAELLHESALNEALEAFEDPKNLHQFGWIERPESEADLPSWLTDIDIDDEGGD